MHDFLLNVQRQLDADDFRIFLALAYYAQTLRLRWGFLDERIPVPWVDRDEQTLYDLEKSALAMNVPLEVVVGSAPGWSEPWSRRRLARVERDPDRWRSQHWLVGDDGSVIDEATVQRARLSVRVH